MNRYRNGRTTAHGMVGIKCVTRGSGFRIQDILEIWHKNIKRVQSTLCNLKHCFVQCQTMFVVVYEGVCVGLQDILLSTLENPGIRFHSNWTTFIPFDSQHSYVLTRCVRGENLNTHLAQEDDDGPANCCWWMDRWKSEHPFIFATFACFSWEIYLCLVRKNITAWSWFSACLSRRAPWTAADNSQPERPELKNECTGDWKAE